MNARDLLERALYARDSRPWFTVDAVANDIMEKRAQFWPGERSAMVTTITDYTSTGERVIDCWLAAGELGEIVNVIRPGIEEYARHIGCTQGMIVGRRGWGKVLAPHGYEEFRTVYRKLFDQ